MLFEITDEDVQPFVYAGYDGKIYKLYNTSFVTGKNFSHTIHCNKDASVSWNITYFYPKLLYGVLECDIKYLTKIYGTNSQLTFVAGGDDANNNGVIITDYVADSIISFSSNYYPDYQSLIGINYYKGTTSYLKIDGIVETGYKTRYADIIDEYKKLESYPPASYSKEYEKLTDTIRYQQFAQEVKTNLAIAYTFVDDWVATLSSDPAYRNFEYVNNISLTAGDKVTSLSESAIYNPAAIKGAKKIKQGEMLITVKIYNEIHGTNYNSQAEINKVFKPFELTMTLYDNNQEVTFEQTFNVVGLNGSWIINEQDLQQLVYSENFAYSLYFEDTTQLLKIKDLAFDNGYKLFSHESDTVFSMTNMIRSFMPLFELLLLLIIIICLVYLISFGASTIKRNKYQIGVIKALGAKTNNIAGIFSWQMVTLGIAILLTSMVSIYFVTHYANQLLVSSFVEDRIVNALYFDIIPFVPHLVIIDLAIVMVITVLSCLAPILSVHKIKPIQIIKAKE